ncbi:MAG: hypothetical protein HN844_01655 [Planctomycetes bacterium]|jgi:mono/diheme cytochrome c family protein|nr:hypothetical protein [Planctomycetota bacterium]MBT4561286.1 hypothetical protein [Planctomycetota bacterium]MBT7012362.1 hypothetical protein [Planctomycetota bacterium]MBT7317906.1 hypothetical protein [Planctomycetota bacterium]
MNFKALLSTAILLLSSAALSAQEPVQEPDPEGPPGRWVYMRHCVQCHAGNGDATGYMAEMLMPRPRDFTREPFRIVSGAGGKATLDDVTDVIYNGIPGTAMPAYKHLPKSWSLNAAAFVLSLVPEAERAVQEELKCPSGDHELKTEGVDVENLYQAACGICHGKQGHGDGVPAVLSTLKDSLGHPIRPRAFATGVMKGGRDTHSLMNRIRFGMPGSPMPAFPLPEDQLMGLAKKVQSLTGEAVPHVEQIQMHSVPVLPADQSSEAWSGIPSTRMLLWPLDWRNEPAVAVDVQLAHDGATMAARMAWDVVPKSSELVLGVMGAIDVSAYLDAPYFRIHDGVGHDLCLPRIPEHMPEPLQRAVSATPFTSSIVDGHAVVVQQRPLAANEVYSCDLTPGSGDRWFACRVAVQLAGSPGEPDDHPEAAAFTLWAELKR